MCGLVGQLADWQQSIGELGRALTTATEGRPLPGWSTEVVARHHHAHLLAATVELGG
ncbi:hypothetical protein [Streptomyces ambofaciens]|uniref:hypothetical protein n=1 Tax=Streptomyces ambofaciens TaxID=1889 RepID=UPI000AC4E70D|nr:hypothetical protein [Streptomyces ambofaciens]